MRTKPDSNSHARRVKAACVGREQAPRSSGSGLAKIVAGTASPRLLIAGLRTVQRGLKHIRKRGIECDEEDVLEVGIRMEMLVQLIDCDAGRLFDWIAKDTTANGGKGNGL